MKNAINYYYNLYPQKIVNQDNNYYFYVNNIKYTLILYEGELKDLKNIYDMHLELLQRNIYVHPMIPNKDNQIITNINGLNYILMQLQYDNYNITLNDINNYSNIIIENSYDLKRSNWGEMWAQKNDYLEYEINMLGKKHPIIRDSFSYYIGLGETAIQLVNSLEPVQTIKVCSHRRITNNSDDFYNPLNIVVDIKVRDAAEYFKFKFFQGIDINDELKSYLNNNTFSTYEYLMFFARMLYPTYYFDLYEDIISEKKSDDLLVDIINKSSEYEKVLKSLYNYYKTFLTFTPIEWLE